VHGIPVFSLYGSERRPSDAMLDTFDVLLVDLQDLGCRIYTFITTLRYVLEEAARTGKSVWVLDRPNPVGRVVEGLTLRPGWESFVGAGPLPMRHGLTLGELARWFVSGLRLRVDCQVVTLQGWQPLAAPGYGWPTERTWGNPAPTRRTCRWHAATPARSCSRARRSRGTRHHAPAGSARRARPRRAGPAAQDALARAAVARGLPPAPLLFEPTFHKHAGSLRRLPGAMEAAAYYDHERFRPWRLFALAFKALRSLRPDFPLWRDFAYEYEQGRPAIDVINGGPLLREWVDDPAATAQDLELLAQADEADWRRERQPHLL
jgi:uncharacterized protein YbbC (DUF1343 family)